MGFQNKASGLRRKFLNFWLAGYRTLHTTWTAFISHFFAQPDNTLQMSAIRLDVPAAKFGVDGLSQTSGKDLIGGYRDA